MKKLIFLALILSVLHANSFFDTYIKDKPKGIVRDFYIWQYLQTPNLTSAEISEAYGLISNKNPYLKKTLANLHVQEELPRDLICSRMSLSDALNQDAACLSKALKLPDILTLDAPTIAKIKQVLGTSYPLLTQSIDVLSSKDLALSLLDSQANVFVNVFNALPYAIKQDLFSTVPENLLEDSILRLSSANLTSFSTLLTVVVLDPKFLALKEALTKIYLTKITHNAAFLLGINEVQRGDKTKAIKYFKQAYSKASDPLFKDRALFWQYLVGGDKDALKQAAQSTFVDLFSIAANQILKTKPKFEIVTSLPEIRGEKAPFDISDPYKWQELSAKIVSENNPIELKNIIQNFEYKDSMAQFSYVMQRMHKYSKNYYIHPYEHLLTWDSIDQKSFVYAIAKQESHFLPSIISRSFALGIMQIMPANVMPFAKDMGLDSMKYEDLFKPEVGLSMGRYYIEVLRKEFKHPLFVAYAYNGGPGFLRRLLAQKRLFIKGRAYEPWLSLELVPYEESRFYGMRVLANYIIYERLFGRDINVEELLDKALIY
ncbi:lytic transglycosylase domain-containing protein [Helicobacter sp. 11S02629-2]|uniref:lytic transglycosylase domain-containing protein n=1 Tax=Helicobacter sp. 11S02629-2 TaxID=1476195 RepID=UPI000BA7BD33|nr:lytic transglycosylase domain-containing protein [Helicobacter sp. 11S02629-2]PAF45739.1 hypothetical protein BKH40_02365 [Helicobacter sp. 11S02629-2]